MGKQTRSCGTVLREIASRHATAQPLLKRLGTRFFGRAAIPIDAKVQVANSLIMSRECYAGGSHPVLNTNERTRLHSNIMQAYRHTVSEKFSDNTDDGHRLADSDIIHVYGFGAPYTVIRFLRLRLSIRLLSKAPIELLGLLYASRMDSRSWLAALLQDIAWMGACDRRASFTPLQWFRFVCEQPKQTRATIRRICDSSAARHTTLSDTRPAIRRLANGDTCFCGRIGKSEQLH